MGAGGLDPYDEDDLWLSIELSFTRAELDMLNRMAERGKCTKSQVVQDIMRDVIADEMVEQGAEKAGALPQEQRVTKCA